MLSGEGPRRTTLRAQLRRFCFEGGDFGFQIFYLAGLVVLFSGTRQFLAEHLQLLLNDFEAFFGFAVHRADFFVRSRWCESRVFEGGREH